MASLPVLARFAQPRPVRRSSQSSWPLPHTNSHPSPRPNSHQLRLDYHSPPERTTTDLERRCSSSPRYPGDRVSSLVWLVLCPLCPSQTCKPPPRPLTARDSPQIAPIIQLRSDCADIHHYSSPSVLRTSAIRQSHTDRNIYVAPHSTRHNSRQRNQAGTCVRATY